MAFSDDQKTKLEAKLNPDFVAHRTQSGKQLSYIEGWHAIAECNRIFGFGEWDRETTYIECVFSGVKDTKNKKDVPYASYIAQVRVTVLAGENEVVRTGTGAGGGFGSDIGEARESAVKEAETDAMKRALMTFGNPFGLALYDKKQDNVGEPDPGLDDKGLSQIRELITKTGTTESTLLAYCKNQFSKDKLEDLSLAEGEIIFGVLCDKDDKQQAKAKADLEAEGSGEPL